MERLALFDDLAKVYKDHGYRLYLVGGTVRDLLLGRPIEDYDFATDATPEEETFLEGADFSFARFGSVHLRDKKAEVTTLRVEGPYKDHRHPSYVKFVKDPLEDYKRRDFTVNAMYLDSDYRLIDYAGGYSDLKDRLLRFIGDPTKRIKEDPLRIIRAYRFAQNLGFTIEPVSLKAIESSLSLLNRLNPDKIKEEERKGYRATE